MNRSPSPAETGLAPTVTLSNGVAMPRLGLGTWPMDDAQVERAVAQAIDLGYRMVDTAENYRNETGVGRGVRASGVPREQVFVTTKFNREWHGDQGPGQALEASLRRLQMEQVDLFLVHWPNPDQDRYVQAFEALTRLQEQGKVRAIGVSNFKPAHLERLFAAGLLPQVNQIQLDPYHLRHDLLTLHRARGIVTECWSPIGRGEALLGEAAVRQAAERLGKTPAQIVLRWHVQHELVPVPKSADAQRQRENLAVFDFALSEAQMQELDALDRPDPAMLDADHFGH